MYIRKKKYNKDLEDRSLIEICESLLRYNKEAEFAISRKFVVENGEINRELNGLPVIIVNKPIDELNILSPYVLVNGDSIAYFYDRRKHLATFVYSQMNYKPGKSHIRQFLDMDTEAIDLAKKYTDPKLK